MRSGQSVFVRVLKDLGGGAYQASFAGGRFNVQSKIPLAPGAAFRAAVLVQNGRLVLTPAAGSGNASVVQGQGAQSILVQNFEALSPEVSAFLANLGLPADEVSARIIQFMTQNGKRLDAGLMQKARRLGEKFSGREKEAAESSLVLEEKGIDSELALDAIMGAGGKGNGRDGGSRGGQWRGREQKDGENGEDGDDNEAAEEILGLFNSLANKKNSSSDFASEKKGWLLIPFEFSGQNGLIRLFCDYEKKITEKLVINLKSTGTTLDFALYFNEGKAAKLVFASDPPVFDEIDGLAKALGDGVEVETVPAEDFSSFGTQDLPLSSVEGFA